MPDAGNCPCKPVFNDKPAADFDSSNCPRTSICSCRKFETDRGQHPQRSEKASGAPVEERNQSRQCSMFSIIRFLCKDAKNRRWLSIASDHIDKQEKGRIASSSTLPEDVPVVRSQFRPHENALPCGAGWLLPAVRVFIPRRRSGKESDDLDSAYSRSYRKQFPRTVIDSSALPR
jgi:hypothetical protein